jgi:molybdopterin-biosynthesis enzyme MoeA-like protein
MSTATRFGLIVIGDEILAGRRRDRHFEGIGALLRERGLELAWLRILPDDPDYLTAELRRSFAEGIPVFSCGGIGSTPDDHTRACAAEAAGVPLVRHPEAVAIIEEKFGEDAYPVRIRLAELPEGAELIPNPVNRMPGFRLREHHFLPGFPDMAHPMAAWVLDHYYGRRPLQRQRSVWVFDANETELMPIMEALTARFPEHKLFSLPRLDTPRRVELGYRGGEEIEVPFQALLAALDEAGFRWRYDDT